MAERKLILLTNDDGVDSPGLWAAAEQLEALGEIWMVAPLTQQTSVGRGMSPLYTGRIEFRVRSLNGRPFTAYGADASPALAVQHALLEILPRQPDLVVSGINYGENIGSGVTVSGTVGAALEAACNGLPALAISLETDPAHYHSHSDEVDFSVAAHFTRLFAEKALALTFPPDVDVLKVEVPKSATIHTPWQITRLSRTRYYVPVKPQRTLLTEPGQLTAINFLEDDRVEPDSDVKVVVVDKQISVTPLSFDLTSRVALTDVKRLLDGKG